MLGLIFAMPSVVIISFTNFVEYSLIDIYSDVTWVILDFELRQQ